MGGLQVLGFEEKREAGFQYWYVLAQGKMISENFLGVGISKEI